MDATTTVSTLTVSDVANYIRLTELSTDETNMLSAMLTIAKNYVYQYTGQDAEDIDDYTDCVIAVLVLCQDMWDNRALYVDNNNVNKVVESILNLHSINLL